MKKTILTVFSLLLVFTLGGAAFAAGNTYTHPTGAFSIDEFGELVEEVELGAFFVDDGAQLMVLFGPAQVEALTEETLPGFVGPVLDSIQEFDDYILDLDNLQSESQGNVSAFLVNFAVESETSDYTAGDVFVLQQADMLYVLVLLAEDYDSVADAWGDVLASFEPGDYTALDEEAWAEEAETGATPSVKATATPSVKATATPTPTKPAPKSAPAGKFLSGFTPAKNGFSFENYGSEARATDLTPAEVQRMFGDSVCASLAGKKCVLTPPAQQWMEQINSYMGGGHCEGMAVLSALMYYDQVAPADFGGSIAADLEIAGNAPLQREIAYWWTTQATYPGAALTVNESPSAVLDTLIENFNQGKKANEWWAMGFYRRDGSAGHAVTPIGVEDKGNGLYHILLYDNNFPNETRILEVNRKTNTWEYEGSPNPEIESFLYDGDASLQNLEVVAISPRLQPQQCDFCGAQPQAEANPRGAAVSKLASPFMADDEYPIWQAVQTRWALLINGDATDFYQVWLTGKSDLLIVDDWGRRLGYAEGEFVNEIPGGSTINMRIFFQQNNQSGLDKDKSPVFRLPVGLSFEVVVDGSQLEEAASSDVALIGPGYYLDVSDIWLEPGEADSIGVFIHRSRHQLTYYTDYAESPQIELGLETDEADYAMLVRATELLGEGDAFDVVVDLDTNEFILNTSYNTEASTYELYVLRVGEDGQFVFGTDELVMEPDNTVYISFQDWVEGSGLPVQFDYENDGEIDDELELPDVTDEVDFYGLDDAE